jgi:hypothetical protein
LLVGCRFHDEHPERKNKLNKITTRLDTGIASDLDLESDKKKQNKSVAYPINN